MSWVLYPETNGKAVVTLLQNASNLVLDFASVYQCAIKPFKHKPQNRSVCTLLLGDKDYKKLPMSDAVCSNYINGKRAIPDNTRIELAKLTDEELASRLDGIGIVNFQLPAEALMHLVEHVKLPKSTREHLLKTYQNSTALSFINNVIHASTDAKDTHPLTQVELTLLSSFSAPEFPAAGSTNTNRESETDADADPDTGIPQEDIEWMHEYVPPKFAVNSHSFFGTPISIDRQVLSMPKDFPALVYLLKPALQGSPIDTFTFEDFTECMGINPANGNLSSGELHCWRLSGPSDGIASAIEGLNLSDVSDVVFLMHGRITLKEATQIEKAIRIASHAAISFIRALCFDSRISEIEATLIVRVDPERAAKLKNIDVDEDGVKIYRK